MQTGIFHKIICNERVANMLIENAKKIYLADYEKTDFGYKVNSYDQKIYKNQNITSSS